MQKTGASAKQPTPQQSEKPTEQPKLKRIPEHYHFEQYRFKGAGVDTGVDPGEDGPAAPTKQTEKPIETKPERIPKHYRFEQYRYEDTDEDTEVDSDEHEVAPSVQELDQLSRLAPLQAVSSLSASPPAHPQAPSPRSASPLPSTSASPPPSTPFQEFDQMPVDSDLTSTVVLSSSGSASPQAVSPRSASFPPVSPRSASPPPSTSASPPPSASFKEFDQMPVDSDLASTVMLSSSGSASPQAVSPRSVSPPPISLRSASPPHSTSASPPSSAPFQEFDQIPIDSHLASPVVLSSSGSASLQALPASSDIEHLIRSLHAEHMTALKQVHDRIAALESRLGQPWWRRIFSPASSAASPQDTLTSADINFIEYSSGGWAR